MLLIAAIVPVLFQSPLLRAAAPSLPPSQYASTITAPFNQASYYPITPTPPSTFYRPVGDWVGRLILPSVEQYQQIKDSSETDWAWFEVQVAPEQAKAAIGQTLRLTWMRNPAVQAYVKTATRNVQFTSEVEKTWQQGVIHPIRLNGRAQVGPLQSLAGAHPYDDVTVVLRGDVQWELGQPTNPVAKPTGQSPAAQQPTIQTAPTLRINREPLQETGRFVALVKFLEPVDPQDPQDLPQKCPGNPPCTSDRLRVQHYNPSSRQFDGPQEVIHIPQQPPDWLGIFNMTTRELSQSPAGTAGWYIYGAKDKAGMFTVQALQPRSLMQLHPQQTLLDFNNGLKYINFGSWQDLESRKGTLQTVLVDPTAAKPEAAQANWQVGDRFLVMHLYGGRGGTQPHSETDVFGTYAGHFSFGVGEVIRDPFTNEPRFDYAYLQVYGNGGDGTLSGANTWANYTGNQRRGILSTRPISDILIKLDPFTQDYQFGDTKLSFFNEFLAELSLMGARYRIGDGTGGATITSATSCVQDSNQALFLTIRRFKEKVEANPQMVEWMRQHPNDPNTQRFQQLVQLGKDLAEQLMPMGIVRWDWAENADILTGVRSDNHFISIDNFQLKNLATGLISWRTAMPRQSNDELAMLFLRHGAKLWFLRPNQIGGVDPGIAPLEPTLLLGAWKLPLTETPLLSYLVIRTFGGVTIPTGFDWFKTLMILLALAAIVLPFGFARGFLSWQPWSAPWYRQLATLLRLLFVPALLQEYVFRVLLNYYPKSWVPALTWWAVALLALGLFVAFQPLYAKLFHRSWYPIFADPTFLMLMTLLGLACTIAYRLTGSLWTITCIHWVVISAWWLCLGGRQRLFSEKALPLREKHT